MGLGLDRRNHCLRAMAYYAKVIAIQHCSYEGCHLRYLVVLDHCSSVARGFEEDHIQWGGTLDACRLRTWRWLE